MSRIDELISELAPDGVPHLPLGKVAAILGRNVQPSAMGNETVTVFSLPSFDQSKSPEKLVGIEVGSAKTRLGGPCVLVSKLNPHIPRVWPLESVPLNSYCSPEFYPIEPDQGVLELRYMYYFVLTKMSWLSGTVTGSTNSHKRLHREDFLKLRIPVPALEVQREIVRILDQFTQLEAELKAELEAELEARRRQYEHYRSELLTFKADTTDFRMLGEVVRIRNGKDHKALSDGDIPVYGSGGIMRYADTAAARGPSVLIPRKGSLGNLFFVEGPFWNVDTIFSTEVDASQIEPKFLFHQLLTMGLGQMNQAGGVPSQTQTVLNRLRIPVPSIHEQQRIVLALDRFDALVNDLSIGLPAELAARRKQYQYYRDNLLTFEEISA
ncbi:restriction endonuclease subunit S [Agreia sp. Leaf210]|uniref:restriction endonuclease subunit S n=1 Tax=Agreia sp. Leaf210 TaxID=1735682 RepID=UPI0009EAF1A8|nr:restriction endonuclease subunit S [Agreia sp. Leaf210]